MCVAGVCFMAAGVAFSRIAAESGTLCAGLTELFVSRLVPTEGQRFAHNSFFCGIEPARESVQRHTGLWCEWGGMSG